MDDFYVNLFIYLRTDFGKDQQFLHQNVEYYPREEPLLYLVDCLELFFQIPKIKRTNKIILVFVMFLFWVSLVQIIWVKNGYFDDSF